jgi:SPP1 family predicted phage head-tail adaptor
MRIGDLRKRIILQYPTRASDNMGGYVLTWNDGSTIFAAIWPVSANEQVEAMQTTMIITHRIRIRYRSDVKGNWRVKFGSRYFSIVSIVDVNMRHQILDLLCKEAA